MDLSEIMSSPAVTGRPTGTVADAARVMREHDIGLLVVTDGSDELVGVITDRDIVVRVVATDQPASTTVGDVIHAGDTLDEIARVVGVERRHRSFG